MHALGSISGWVFWLVIASLIAMSVLKATGGDVGSEEDDG